MKIKKLAWRKLENGVEIAFSPTGDFMVANGHLRCERSSIDCGSDEGAKIMAQGIFEIRVMDCFEKGNPVQLETDIIHKFAPEMWELKAKPTHEILFGINTTPNKQESTT